MPLVGNNDGSSDRSTHSIAQNVLFSAYVAVATLIFLFIFYDGLYHLHIPSLRQLLIGLVPQMVFILIWRHYIFYRMNDWKSDTDKKDHNNNHLLIHQHWYAISCVIFAFGNCLLPLQIIFGDNQLQPNTGDPYLFGIVCTICHAFMDVLLGLNLIIDAVNFGGRKVADWINISHQIQSVMMKVGRMIRQFRAPLTFLLSAKIVLGGVLIAREDPIVVDVEVPIRHLPESLDGFRIIQLSDMHVGVSVGRSRVERAVKIVNELCNNTQRNNERKCNLVALTGDIVDGEPYQLIKAIEPLKQLVPGIPKIFVTGNHEHIHNNVDHTVELLSEMGIDSLVNDNIRLPKGKSRQKQLVVVGLNDISSRQSRGKEQQAFEGTEKDTIILLAHQPNHLKVAQQHGVDLMLSGHTHAGQFFPGTLGAWLFNSKFSGYYPSRDDTAVYVSAGTHWWGPPVRFTTRHHEITDITLRKIKD